MIRRKSMLSRRDIVGGLFATGALLGTSCSKRQDAPDATAAAPANLSNAAAPARQRMIVYRDPSCGCCEKWAELASAAGFEVQLLDRPDMPAIKAQYRVPQELASCHTAIVGGYAIEGHVPLAAVQRLLRERPTDLAGIAVPGMPRGSPGMEMPDGSKDDFEVHSFDRGGKTALYRA